VVLHLRFGALPVDVHTEDPRVRSRLESYFDAFVARKGKASAVQVDALVGLAPDVGLDFTPWNARGKDSFADGPRGRFIRKERTGVLIEARAGRWRITGDLHRNFSQLVNVLGVVYGLSILDRGGAMLHASAVVRDGAALAIIGQSGTGKSSTAVRLLELGFDFLSNDRVIIEARRGGLIAHGLPKLPRVNPGTLLMGDRTKTLLDGAKRHRYQRLPADELRQVEDKYDLDVRETLGRAWQLSAPLRCAIVLSWRAGHDELVLQRLEPGQALEAMRAAAKSFGAFDQRLSERGDDALRRAAATLPVYRAAGDFDPARLAREIDERWGELASLQGSKR
jgi:HprK-related kinase B